ncbi:MAG: glycosyltransferase [Muribaculaceae bacterium]|nr:glycosyltransferase [Muribaculaceae bacterium]
MKVSVIVVTYNQEHTIGRTLDSILAQDLRADYEIVIGDDASTDGTERICRSYAAQYPDRIVYLRRERNLGVTANYFDCIRRARGEYLADCAGDDYWVDPGKLRRQVELLDSDPRVSLVATDWLCRDSDSGELSRHPANPSATTPLRFAAGTLTFPLLAGERIIHLCTALYRRDIITDAVDKNPDIYVDSEYSCEDQQILLAMAEAGDIVVLPEVTLHYSVGHDSVSHPADYARKFRYSLRALRQTMLLQRHFDVAGAALDKAAARRVNHLSAMALRSGPDNEAEPSERRISRLKALIRQFQLPLPLKARLYMAVMRCPALWGIVNRLRK